MSSRGSWHEFQNWGDQHLPRIVFWPVCAVLILVGLSIIGTAALFMPRAKFKAWWEKI